MPTPITHLCFALLGFYMLWLKRLSGTKRFGFGRNDQHGAKTSNGRNDQGPKRQGAETTRRV